MSTFTNFKQFLENQLPPDGPNLFGMLPRAIQQQSVVTRTTAYTTSKNVYLKLEYEQLDSFIEALCDRCKLRVVLKSTMDIPVYSMPAFVLTDDEALVLNINFKNWEEGIWELDLLVTSGNKEAHDEVLNYFRSIELSSEEVLKRNPLYVIAKRGDVLILQTVGGVSKPLLPKNYTPEVLESIQRVWDDFAREYPYGRLTVLSGPPGTGKTHLIRYLCSHPHCKYVLVSQDLVSELVKPQYFHVLLELAHTSGVHPVILIEDGDELLYPREKDRMSTISALLNLSDGIIGSKLNLRVLVTTNAEKVKMDEAFKRPGRLNCHVQVPLLPADQARALFQELTSKDPREHFDVAGPRSLAEVYAAAHQNGYTAPMDPEPKLRQIGFRKEAVNPNRSLTELKSRAGFTP